MKCAMLVVSLLKTVQKKGGESGLRGGQHAGRLLGENLDSTRTNYTSLGLVPR